MKDYIPKEESAAVTASLRRYFDEHFDRELDDLQASLLLDYFMKEIAPFAYNRGVDDARAYFSARIDDLAGVCFEQGLTYWESTSGSSRAVRRKPGR